jgi:6-phospho-3-hexuloisomerase
VSPMEHDAGSKSDGPIATIIGELQAVLAHVDQSAIEHVTRAVDRAPRVFVIGEGRSGFMARAFAMRLMHLGVTAYFVGDTCTPSLDDGDLLVAISGSGTTAATLRAAEAAQHTGARVLAVTSAADSALARLGNVGLIVPAATKHRRPNEPSTAQPLSSLFDQCVHVTLDAVCLLLAGRRRVDNDTAVRAHANTE